MKLYGIFLLTLMALNTFGQNVTETLMESDELKSRLTPIQYHITQEKGTERPFTGIYWNHFEPGIYVCVCCGEELFQSQTKFHSSCGWPSFLTLNLKIA